DVVALAQAGISQAVATLGTATTPDHAELLFRNGPDVYFCFDGDAAGRRAGWRAVESILPRMKDGRQAFYLFLPEGEEPDTIVRKESAAGFDTCLAQATPLSQFYLVERMQGLSRTSFTGNAAIADRCRADILQMPDGGFREAIAERLREVTGVDLFRRSAPPPAVPRRAQPAKRSLVRGAIELLLQKPSLALQLEPPYRFAELRQPGVPLFLEILDLVNRRPDITIGGILEHF